MDETKVNAVQRRPPNNGYRPGWKPVQVYLPAELKERLRKYLFVVNTGADTTTTAADIIRAGLEAELTRRGG